MVFGGVFAMSVVMFLCDVLGGLFVCFGACWVLLSLSFVAGLLGLRTHSYAYSGRYVGGGDGQ